MYVITYPCWVLSKTMLVKGAPRAEYEGFQNQLDELRFAYKKLVCKCYICALFNACSGKI